MVSLNAPWKRQKTFVSEGIEETSDMKWLTRKWSCYWLMLYLLKLHRCLCQSSSAAFIWSSYLQVLCGNVASEFSGNLHDNICNNHFSAKNMNLNLPFYWKKDPPPMISIQSPECLKKGILAALSSYLCLSINKLSLSYRRSLSYRNQTIDFQSKSMDWFLYDRRRRYERVVIEKIW